MREFYATRLDVLVQDEKIGRFAKEPGVYEYIESPPEAGDVSEADMKTCFHKVLTGDLEFAQLRSDSRFKMVDYAEHGKNELSRQT